MLNVDRGFLQFCMLLKFTSERKQRYLHFEFLVEHWKNDGIKIRKLLNIKRKQSRCFHLAARWWNIDFKLGENNMLLQTFPRRSMNNVSRHLRRYQLRFFAFTGRDTKWKLSGLLFILSFVVCDLSVRLYYDINRLEKKRRDKQIVRLVVG